MNQLIYSLLRNNAAGLIKILPGPFFLIYLWGRSLGIRPRSVLQKSPADGGALLMPFRSLIPKLRLQTSIKKQAPEGFELDRKLYYVTKRKLDAVNTGHSCLVETITLLCSLSVNCLIAQRKQLPMTSSSVAHNGTCTSSSFTSAPWSEPVF